MVGSDMAAVIFGLASALSWGAGDFSGGLATKRTSVYGVVILSQVIGVLLLIGLALVLREEIPPPADLVWGAVAGLGGGLGLVALYTALASGRMGVAAPLSAVVSAVIPVAFAMFSEGLPTMGQFAGFGLALVAVWFISRSDEARPRMRDLGLPLMAGLGFGLFFVALDRANSEAVLWPVVATRLASAALLTTMARFTRQRPWPGVELWGLIALSGVLDTGGNAFYALAARVGRLDVAAVLGSLYPASTVWLAWLILKERLTRLQWVGVIAALASIVLITV